MQRLQPYYVLNSVCAPAHHFRVAHCTNISSHLTWNGTDLTLLDSKVLKRPAKASGCDVPPSLIHVRHRIVERLGTSHGVSVQYEGYFTLYTVTKMVAILVQGKLRIAQYTAQIAITPDFQYRTLGLIHCIVTIPKRLPPPLEVLNHYSTIDKTAVRAVVNVDGTPDWNALDRLCNYEKELSPELLHAVQRPPVPITYFNATHTLRVDVQLERFQGTRDGTE